MIGELKTEITYLKSQLEQTKPAVEETTEETRPEPETTPEPEPPKPKAVIPQGSASKEDALEEDGVFRF